MSTLKDVARGLTRKSSLTKTEAETFVQLMFDVAKQGMGEDGTVKIKGLGTFKLQTVKQRESVNVNTGERVLIDSHDRISFTPDANMRDLVNKPFAHFETVVLNDGVDFDEIGDVNAEEDEEETQSVPLVEPVVPLEPEVSIQLEPEVPLEPEPEVPSEPEVSIQPEPVIRIVHSASLEPVEIEKFDKEDTPEEQEEETNDAAVIESENATEDSAEDVAEDVVEDKETEKVVHGKHMGKDKIKRRIRKYKKGALITLLSLFMLAVGFVIGRATASYHLSDITSLLMVNSDVVNATVVPEDAETPEPKKVETAPDTAKVVKKEELSDSVNKKPEAQKETEKQTAPKETAEPVKAVAPKETPKESAKETPKPQAKAETSVSSSKYDSDPRVRTGAYRITGVAQTVTAKEGQTIESISKLYLGPGMECYVEALNGKDIKPGQKVKIPQLQLKKKTAKQ